jgi:hypothetical protein
LALALYIVAIQFPPPRFAGLLYIGKVFFAQVLATIVVEDFFMIVGSIITCGKEEYKI